MIHTFWIVGRVNCVKFFRNFATPEIIWQQTFTT